MQGHFPVLGQLARRAVTLPRIPNRCFGAILLGLLCWQVGGAVPTWAADGPKPPSIAELRQEVAGLAESLGERQTRQRLIAIDDSLVGQFSAEVRALRASMLKMLGDAGEDEDLWYLRSVFESDTEFRDEAAHGLSLAAIKSPNDLQDWRFLIRSLPMLEGEQAVSVMKALLRFRQRATNSHWIRRVILLGLKLPEEQQQVAIDLLRHWSGMQATESNGEQRTTLASYQEWYRQKWPEEPTPEWPTEPAEGRWTYRKTKDLLETAAFSAEQVQQGREVYVKTNCSKCHIKGNLGTAQGPNLSDIAAMRQRKELLEAILFPSLELHEDFPSATVVTLSGKILTGLMSAEKDGNVRIVDINGQAQTVARNEIEQLLPSLVSNMPTGALEPLSTEELLALFAFLEFRENPQKPYHALE